MPFGDHLQLAEDRDLGGRAPGGHAEPALRGQRLPHLARRQRPIGEELQALLADHHVETARRRSSGRSRALPSRQVTPGATARATSSIAGLISTPTTVPPGPDPLVGDPRHDAGAAGDVEHPVAGCRAQAIEQHLGPRTEERADQPLLVHRRKALLVVRVGRQRHRSLLLRTRSGVRSPAEMPTTAGGVHLVRRQRPASGCASQSAFPRRQHGVAPRRQAVADLEALGQPQRLQLAHVDLERQPLAARPARQRSAARRPS